MGDREKASLRLQFNPQIRLEFHGATITSDAGLLAFRELDDALGLTPIAFDYLQESRTGRNIRHHLVPLLRQSIYSRLAGYDDTNDAERLSQDPAMRVVVGWQGSDRNAARTNTMSRFETETLTQEDNLKGLALMNPHYKSSDASCWGMALDWAAAGLQAQGRGELELKLDAQVLHASVSLDAVAVAAEKLEVFQVVGSALATRDDVIDFKVSCLEVLGATRAVAFLNAVEREPVRSVGWEMAQVGTHGNVRAGRDVPGVKEAAHRLLQAHVDELGGLGANVDARPSAVRVVGGNQGRRATTERVEHHVPGIRGCGDDAIQEGKGLLCGVAGAFIVMALHCQAAFIPQVADSDAGVFIEIDPLHDARPELAPTRDRIPAALCVNMLVLALDCRIGECTVDLVKSEVGALRVVQKHVVFRGELAASRILVAAVLAPGDFVDEARPNTASIASFR